MRLSDCAFIGGRWVPVSGPRIEVVNPATEAVIGTAPDCGAEVVGAAVGAARDALASPAWRKLTLERRIDVCLAAVAAIGARIDEFARGQTEQMGVPITASKAMVASGPALTGAYIDGARSIDYAYLRGDAVGRSLVRRPPAGVVAAVIPWNGPLPAAMNKIVPALLAGCTMVIKPAPQTPWEAGLLAELFTSVGLPPGVLNVVPGGPDTGRALVGAPGVDQVTFTGSSAAGAAVGEICGRLLRRHSLELGGKSPGIVLDDADFDQVVPQLVSSGFFNSGQICVALTRLLVPRARQADLADALCSAATALVLGDPLDPATQVGPLVSRAARDRVEDLIGSGRAEGAEVVLGGPRPDRPGWYVAPTVFTGVRPTMRIAREEIFGPVLSVMAYDDEDEAVAIANSTDYGLHGAVFSADPERAFALANRIDSGTVSVNVPGLTPGTPYGGTRSSGVGREHGREGVEAYLDLRATVVPAAIAQRLAAAGATTR